MKEEYSSFASYINTVSKSVYNKDAMETLQIFWVNNIIDTIQKNEESENISRIDKLDLTTKL